MNAKKSDKMDELGQKASAFVKVSFYLQESQSPGMRMRLFLFSSFSFSFSISAN